MLNDAQNRKLLAKLRRALETYEPYFFTGVSKLPFRMYETDERLHAIPDDALFESPETRTAGTAWGGEGRTCWFSAAFTVPPELDGQTLYLRPDVGGYEAMLWVNGVPRGTFATKIVVTRHGNHYCDCICAHARAGETLRLHVEFYAGHYVIGEQPFEERVRSDFHFDAKALTVCTKNQDVVDFALDLRILLQLADKLPASSFRRAGILNALTQVHQVLCYDPDAAAQDVCAHR